MTLSIALVYAIVVVAIVLFVRDKMRPDVIGLLLLLALFSTGELTVSEALAGFSDPIVLMIAGLLVVGEALMQTGVAARLGQLPLRLAKGSPRLTLLFLMILVATLSAFMSSTGTVAVMIPVAMAIARATHTPPAQLMMPLAIASMLGGTLTLIGTPPNLVAAGVLAGASTPENPLDLHFFSLTPVGLVVAAAGLVYVMTWGRRLLPNTFPQGHDARPSLRTLRTSWGVDERVERIVVAEGSTLCNAPFGDADLRARFDVYVVEVERRDPRAFHLGTRRLQPTPTLLLEAGDILHVRATREAIASFCDTCGVQRLEALEGRRPEEVMGVAEVILTPRSRLVGRTLREARFRDLYEVNVLGIRRMGKPLDGGLADVPLAFGDTLLVEGPWRRLQLFRTLSRDFVLAEIPDELESAPITMDRAAYAIVILAVLLVVMTLGIVPHVIAVFGAALAMVLTRCINMDDAYRSMNWRSLVLIASILPVATALENTGGMALLVSSLTQWLATAPPHATLFVFLFATSVMSQVISNTATTVLLAPIALQTAVALGFSPLPFVVGVAIAASTAFSTPIGSPVNLLVLAPGGYTFRDFLRVGVPLQLLVLLVALVAIPLFFPF